MVEESASTSPSSVFARLLDPRARGGARELGAEAGVVVAELHALAAVLVEAHVQLEHGHVDGDDSRRARRRARRSRARRDRRDASARPTDVALCGRASASARAVGATAVMPSPPRAGAPTPSAGSRRSRRADGRTGFRVSSRSSGSRPQTQIGKSGGQVQPFASSRRKFFTIRSSSEWKEITASRPPGRSIRTAAGSAASSAPSSSLTAIRSAWKTRFAGWPSPKRAGVGIAVLIVSTSSPVRSNGRSIAAADDLPRDLPRVALLAVAAEDQRQLALVGLVDELPRRELGRRVHAHVERRVGRVREAALRPVELHRRDAEVEQDRVGLDVVRRELAEHERELAAQQPRADAGARRSRSKYVRTPGSRSIAISCPSPRRSSASRREWPPAPKVPSTTVSPGWTARSSRTSSASTGTWSAALLCKTFGNMICAPFHGRQVDPPRLAVPDLEMVVDARHDDLPPELGALEQRRRHEHPPLLVELDVRRPPRRRTASTRAPPA